MKTKTIFLWMLLLMIVGGVNFAWPNVTYKLSLNGAAQEAQGNGAYSSTLNYFSYTGGFNDKFKDATYAGIAFTKGLKMQSGDGTVTFTVAGTATVTVVQSSWSDTGINLDDTSYASSTAVSGTGCRVYTIDNVSSGTHTIKRGGNSESGLFFVQVEQTEALIAPTSSFAYGNNCLAVIPVGEPSTTFNNTFTTNSDGNVTYTITDDTTLGTASTVDTDGNVTVSGTGTLTVNASVAATSTYAAQVNSYTLRVNQAAQFSVDIDNLKMLIPYGGVNANYNINRTIPNLDITFGGGDGVKFNSASEFLFRQSGTLELALRKLEGGEGAAMTTIVLTGSFSNYNTGEHSLDYYIQASSGTLVKTSDSQLTWTGLADEVTFTSQNRGVTVSISDFTITHNGYLLNTAKVTPEFSFSPSSQSALVSSSQEYATTFTSSPGFFNAVSFNDVGSTGTVLKANQPVVGGTGTGNAIYTLQSGTTNEGTATLTASNMADSYFNAATTATYTLTVGAGLSTLTEFAFNRTDVLYQGAGGNVYINNTFYNKGDSDPFEFTYDVSRSTIRTKLNLDPGLSTIGASATSTYFAVESSDPTVLDVSSVSFTSASNGTRIYVNGIQVLKAGTATLTYRFLGSETYAATSCSIVVNVKPTIATYSGSYPFTWDFTSTTSWDGSKLQATYQNSNWTYNNYHQSFQSTQSSVSADNGIDKIRGLAFPSLDGSNNAYNLFLDPGDNGRTAQLAMSGQMTVPNLSPDFEVTITGATGQTITVGGSALTESPSGTYIYRPTTTGDVTFSVAEVGKALHTIQVTRVGYTGAYTYTTSTDLHEGTPGTGDDAEKYLIDGKERKLKGTYSFTGDGGFINGTTISDVPGITATFAKGSDELQVKTVDNSTGGRYVGHVLTSLSNNATITFTPYVNGYLSLQGNFYSDTNINDGTSNIWTVTHNTHTFYADLTEITIPLIAGKTYVLGGGYYAWELHAFSFRPAFLEVENTEALTYKRDGEDHYVVASKNEGSPFAANKGIRNNRYPKLITTDEGKVKFAGDRSIVNLNSNNDVDLLGSGSTIIKGTVLLEGSDEELFTYYYLQSTILELEKIGKQPNRDFEYSDTTAIVNQDYVDEEELENGSLVFRFNYPIERVQAAKDNPGGVKFRIVKRTGDYSEWTAINNGWTNDADKANNNFIVNVGTLDEGMTYQFMIEANVLKKSDDPGVMNSEIFLMFTVNKDLEVPIKMIYPTGIASVGTSIVLETTLKGDDGNSVGINDNHKVLGRLKKSDGTGDEMEIYANFSGNRLIFKPTSTLASNTQYSLKILADETETSATGGQIIMKDAKIGGNTVIYKVTTDKEFYFTTGTAAGTNPVATAYSPVNDPDGNVPVTAYSEGRISITFDQKVEIEPYSTVYATPVNGSESTTTGYKAMTDEESATTMHVDTDNKTVYFDYGADGLKYDLYYEIKMPVNTIIGAGGKPNSSEVTFRFKMAKNPNATSVDPEEFYPHTWDFCKLGSSTDATAKKTAYRVTTYRYNPGSTYNFLAKSGNSYVSVNQKDKSLDQGNDVYIQYRESDGGAVQKYILPEFEGMRVSLTNNHSNRFELENRTLGSSDNKNDDGTDKWLFRLNGNTHYFTLSNVPKGKLYMVVSTLHLGINSPNAVFEEKSGDDHYILTNNNTLLNTNQSMKKVVVNVTEAGDVSFCVKNFSCEKIAVSDYSKTFKRAFAVNEKSYATDCVNENIRYDLVNAFTDDNVKAYYVSTTSGNIATATELKETATSTAASKGGEGVIVVLQKAVGADTEIPFFVTDVNTAINTSDNLLEGTTTEITNFDNSQKNKYFFSNVYTQLSKDKTELEGTPEWITTTQMGFYRAVGTKVSAHKAWLEVPGGGSARQYYLFKAFDDGETPTAIDGVETKDMNDDAWYSLQGVRVTNPVKGNLYIHNGKKVVIK